MAANRAPNLLFVSAVTDDWILSLNSLIVA
jgi:hypothetical protein